MRRISVLFLFGLAGALAVTGTSVAKGPDTLWTRTYGRPNTDIGYDVVLTSDGGFTIVGWTKEDWPYRRHAYLVKTDRSGEVEWEYIFDSRDNDYGYDVTETSDRGFVYMGDFYKRDQDSDIFLSKLSETGNHLWKRTYDLSYRDYAYDLEKTDDGGYFIAGYSDTLGRWADIILIRTDAKGNSIWSRTYGGDASERAYACAPTLEGGCILAGYKFWDDGWWSVGGLYLLGIDAFGDTLWTRLYKIPGVGGGKSIAQTSDGCYVVCAARDRWPGYETPDHYDCFAMKIDALGDSVWTSTWGADSSNEIPEEIIETVDGNYVIVGTTRPRSADTEPDVYLAKITVEGDTLWTRTYGGSDYDAGHSVQQASDGSYIVAGLTTSFGAGGADVYLIKTFPESNIAPPLYFEASLPWPNPLLESTTLSLELSRPERVTVSLYDASGRYICKLLDETVAAGRRKIPLDFTEPPAGNVASGVYFMHLQAGSRVAARKVVLIR